MTLRTFAVRPTTAGLVNARLAGRSYSRFHEPLNTPLRAELRRG